jgi:1-acyl-sn-glycerol-3-phosphate acyltransferase
MDPRVKPEDDGQRDLSAHKTYYLESCKLKPENDGGVIFPEGNRERALSTHKIDIRTVAGQARG